jgi:hypothetical protein
LEAQGEDADSPVTTVRNPHSDSWTDTWHIQSNVRAHGKAVRHTIVWTEKADDDIDEEALYTETGSKSGRGFVRLLEMGDRIAVIAWAKVGFRAFHPSPCGSINSDGNSQYPGWENHVKKIDLEVYYSV